MKQQTDSPTNTSPVWGVIVVLALAALIILAFVLDTGSGIN